MDTTEKPEITLAGKPITIGKPRPSLILPIAVVAAHNETIAQAAALGICWQAGTEKRPPADYRRFKSNPQSFGEAVIDELTDRGVPAADIVRAGRECLTWLLSGIITATEPEVAAAVGNSEEQGSTP